MKTIKSPNELMDWFLTGKKHPSGRYRIFSYLVFQPCCDGILLYNMLTGELILLDDAEAHRIKTLPCDYEPWMDQFIDRHFLVPEDADDMRMVKNLRTLAQKLLKEKGITTYVILPTTGCNAHCFYCFEKGAKPVNMSDETADKAVDFIAENCQGQKVTIRWYGGEPLIGARQIDRICNALRQRGVEFESIITSNGLLFSQALAKKAAEEWNLTSAQITLDGTEQVYNRVKAYTTECDSPYRRVLANIGHLIDSGVFVHIRLNVGLYNIDDMDVLIPKLAGELKGKEGFDVYCHSLNNNEGPAPMHYSLQELEKLQEELFRLQSLLNKLQIGIKKELPFFKLRHCLADYDNYVMILPSGKLGKCETHVEDRFIGSLDEGITDIAQVNRLKETVETPACRSCLIYPHCILLKYCIIKDECTATFVKLYLEDIRAEMSKVYDEYSVDKEGEKNLEAEI